MAIYWLTPDFKGRTFKLCVLTRWDFNFCVRSSPLRESLTVVVVVVVAVVVVVVAAAVAVAVEEEEEEETFSCFSRLEFRSLVQYSTTIHLSLAAWKAKRTERQRDPTPPSDPHQSQGRKDTAAYLAWVPKKSFFTLLCFNLRLRHTSEVHFTFHSQVPDGN